MKTLIDVYYTSVNGLRDFESFNTLTLAKGSVKRLTKEKKTDLTLFYVRMDTDGDPIESTEKVWYYNNYKNKWINEY